MKMVAASKLRRAHEAQTNAKLYANNLTALISRISASVQADMHPLLVAREQVKRVLVLVVTSDKGLCGAFNHNANKHVEAWVEKQGHRFEQIDLSFCGKKGWTYFKNRHNVNKYYEGVTENPKFLDAKTIGTDLTQAFLNGEYDEVYIDYNQFFSPLSQETIFEKILPLDPQRLIKEKVEKPTEYIFEPEAAKLLEFLIPHFLYFKIYFALLENAAGEHGARMTAMDNATRNASDLINRTTLLRNRARQASITTELTEIVAGAEALT